MRGVILCGGSGTRLGSLTTITNKHLLPIYDKPMVHYPINTLVNAGIKEIMIIVSGEYGGSFIKLLQNGEEFGLKNLTYAYQNGNKGIADALSLAESFANGDHIAVILGDNATDANISNVIKNFDSKPNPGAHLFLKEVPDANRFGVVRFEENNSRIIEIIEKPITPPSSYAVTGLYLYDNTVFKYIKKCVPSKRQELEITDVNNFYIRDNNISWSMLNGFWQDAGNVNNLYLANKYWYEKNNTI
jgi:glucose-1-phosphate thymidylyltransferase